MSYDAKYRDRQAGPMAYTVGGTSRRSVVSMDDRAAGHDDLLLAHPLQPAEPGPARVCRAGELPVLVAGPLVLSGHREHSRPDRIGIRNHSSAGNVARRALRAPFLWAKRRHAAGHRAILRHADGERTGLEEHDHASGVWLAGAGVCRAGSDSHRLVWAIPDAVAHHHTLLGVAAVRLSDSVHVPQIPRPGAEGSGAY